GVLDTKSRPRHARPPLRRWWLHKTSRSPTPVADSSILSLLMRGYAPQPRLLWAVGIGAALIALSVVSPLLIFVAVVYHFGLVVLVARALAVLPGRGGFMVRRVLPEPLSLGEHEEVRVVVTNGAAAGLDARVADHAPPGLLPRPREVAGSFDKNGTLAL